MPFFKNIYSKMRQSGALYRLRQKWKQVGKSSKHCNVNGLRPISFKKIVSLIIVMVMGVCLALFIIIGEKIAFKIKMIQKKNQKHKFLEDSEDTEE